VTLWLNLSWQSRDRPDPADLVVSCYQVFRSLPLSVAHQSWGVLLSCDGREQKAAPKGGGGKLMLIQQVSVKEAHEQDQARGARQPRGSNACVETPKEQPGGGPGKKGPRKSSS
jgi:hypothetical protein